MPPFVRFVVTFLFQFTTSLPILHFGILQVSYALKPDLLSDWLKMMGGRQRLLGKHFRPPSLLERHLS